MGEIFKILLAVIVVGALLLFLISVIMGAKLVWTDMDEGRMGGACTYYGFWAKEIDVNQKMIVFEKCQPYWH